MRRTIRLRLTLESIGPCMVGIVRPMVIVPLGMLTGLPRWQVEAILAHELVHVRRYDFLANFVQSLAEVLLFYHPVVWRISRCMRVEREYCCDDRAARSAGGVLAYARALVAVERYRHAPVGAPAASGGSLRDRVERMLARRRSATP